MTADWGLDQEPPAWVPRVMGWAEAPYAPMWAFLPAVWPRRHRAWIPMQRDRVAEVYEMNAGGKVVARKVLPWTEEDYATVEADINALLAEAGVPPRPEGRTWYLRLPVRITDLDDVLAYLNEDADAMGIPTTCNADFVAHVSRKLREEFSW